MSPFRIRGIEPWGKGQVIVWLEDEQTGATGDDRGGQWCLRLTLPEVASTVADLFAAYTTQMQNLAVDLAAGGCRTCGNSRKINVDHFAKLTGGDGGGEPCPVCVPRAEKRLRERVWGLGGRRRAS